MEMKFRVHEFVQLMSTQELYVVSGLPDDNALEHSGQPAYGYRRIGGNTTLWRSMQEVEDGRFSSIGRILEGASLEDDLSVVGKFRVKDLVVHLRSKGMYRITHTPEFNRLAESNEPAYGYRNMRADGVCWWRARTEMEDGRFDFAAIGG